MGGRFGTTMNRLGGLVKGVGLVAGAVAIGGVAALAIGIKKAIDNAAEGQRIIAETDRVITSMGAGAWTSTEQVTALAGRLGRVTAAGDEAVQEVANLVLTFGNIQNQGEGVNAVFDRTVGLSVDLAKVMGTDNKSAAIQLGKALNDPVKGITALTRSGVTFTEQQKDQIKTLIASGKTLEAQKIILAEVERQVGGAAEAYGKTFLGAIDRAKNAVGDMSELLGGPLLDAVGAPAASGFADWLERVHDILEPLSKRLTEMFTRLDVGGKIAAKLQPALDAVERGLTTMVARFEQLTPEIEAAIEQGDWEAVRVTLGEILNAAVAGASPDLARAFNVEGANWETVKGQLGAKIKDVIFSALDALAGATGELAGKIGGILGRMLLSTELWTGVARGMWDALATAWQTQGAAGIAKIAVALAAGIGLLVAGAPALVAGLGAALIGALAGKLVEGTARLTEIVVNWIATAVEKFVLFAARIGETLFKGAIKAGEMIGKGLGIITQTIAGWISRGVGAFVNFVATIVETLFTGAIRAGEAFGRGLIRAWGAVERWFRGLPGAIGRTLGNIGSWLVRAGEDLVVGLWNGIAGMGRWLYGQIMAWARRNIPGPILDLLGISSPSKLMAKFGEEIPAGLAKGIRSNIGLVERVVRLMVRALQHPGLMGSRRALAPPPVATAPGRLGPAMTTGPGLRRQPTAINNHITFAGPVAGEEQMRALLQRLLREYARRNGSVGF